MKMTIAAAAAAAALMFAGSAGAGAVVSVGDVGDVLDFTDNGRFSGLVSTAQQPITGTFGGAGFSITSSGKLNFSETAVGTTCPVAILDCEHDGVGVSDDEITGGSGSGQESITITFGRAVTVGQIILLDLFIGNRGAEQAIINGLTFTAVETLGGGRSGTRIIDFNRTVSQLVFSAAKFAGDDGTNDYAIGGVTAVVPLPPTILLLFAALAGIGIAGRRRSAV
jgi:hypothetical protein